MQHLPLSAPADHSTLSCKLQSNFPQQKRRRLLQLNTKLECPGPCTQPLDPASTVHAIWNYKIKKARSLNTSDAVNTIYFYDLEEPPQIIGELSQPNLPTNLIRNLTTKKISCLLCAHDHRKLGTPYLQEGWLHT